MSEAANLSNSKLDNKINSIKTKIPNVDENKLKNLEARFAGPSSNGNLPIEFDTIGNVEIEFIKSNNNTRNNSQNEGLFKKINEKDNFNSNSFNQIMENNQNNSNKSLNNKNFHKNSARKKNQSKKAEKTTKYVGGISIDYLSTKRIRNDNESKNNNNSKNNIQDKTSYIEIKEESNNELNNSVNNNNKTPSENNRAPQQNNLEYSGKNLNSPNLNKQKKNNNFFKNITNLADKNQINSEKLLLNEDEVKKEEISLNKYETNNPNNINNLNNILNIQNANFINTIQVQELSYGSSVPEENIEFSSKNVVSSANLFYNTKDSMGNIISTKGNCNNLKNQSNLDQYTSKNGNINMNNRINDTKINSYFNKSTNNHIISNTNSINCSNFGTTIEDKNTRILKQNYLKLVEENEKLIKDLAEKNKLSIEKEKENEKLKIIFQDNEKDMKNLNNLNKDFENQIMTGRKSLMKYLKDYEDLKRTQNKQWLNEQAYKLGKFSIQRAGTRLIEVWEDGEKILNLKQNIKDLKNNKEDLEKFKKRLANAIKKKDTKEKGEKQELNPNQLNQNLSTQQNNNFLLPNNIYHNNNIFSYNNTNLEDYNDHDILELKELINFKVTKITKDESECLEKLEKLEIEKIKYQIEFKRFLEEEKCRYGINSKEKWPILSNRYLILSLLGRGGYSEAYDLENHIEVACKIHQLNPTWSDTIKENYIRHTIRENQIHKEINHPKVVKHYDTIEIDTSSFCTVLELCSGPDLYTYLKLNKTLPERDARIIVSQILSGVEYLNKLQKKIIHYDLKPQNIIFHNMEVKISDFGLAKIMEDNSDKIELTSQGVGTYWYLPPECFDTDKNPPGISSKVDVWSTGVILFELVFGIRPFGHSLTQDRILKENVITNAKKVEFPQKPIVSEECKDFIKRCLAHNQDERYDVFEALESGFIKGLNQKKNKN